MIRRRVLAGSLALAVVLAIPAMAGLPRRSGAAPSTVALIVLRQPSTLSAYASARRAGRAEAAAASKARFARIKAAQAQVSKDLPRGTRVLYRTHALVAGLVVRVSKNALGRLRGVRGVARVVPIAPKRPANSYAVPLTGGATGWEAHGSGQGASIAIIDTGVDYTHADLGGAGTVSAYQTELANDTATTTAFPSAKVVGGADLVGDAYDGGANSTPAPDSNPLDCQGHGTEVAGSAAGYGENADGSTYTGAYSTATPFGSLRIGPGMAPAASIYAYKVFGCSGTTQLAGAALDAAADPNHDGDPSDHVDVALLPLVGAFTGPDDGDAVMANQAVDLGITVVAPVGNDGDLFDAGGAPGSAAKALTVANSADAYSQVDGLSLSAPVAIAGDYAAERTTAYDWVNDPDLSGTVARLSDASNLDGCQALNGTDAAAVAGKIAFLEWSGNPSSLRCDAATAAANVAHAGAVGYILADDTESLDLSPAGSAAIPGVLVSKSGADAIRAELAAAHTVTVSGTIANGFAQFSSAQNDMLNNSSSRGAREAGDVKPDVTAPGTTVFSAGMGSGNQGALTTGTSSAAAFTAGLAALVKATHPDWTPEEIKADIVNTADQDVYTGPNHTGSVYPPNRVGSGRIDVAQALDNTVLAYVANDPGAVSVSFGPVEVTSPTLLTKTVDVTNTTLSQLTYSIAYAPIDQMPGANYSVSTSSIDVPARSTRTFTVSLVIPDPSALSKALDSTSSATQGGVARSFVADVSGRLLLTSSGRPTLRVPVYAAPRAASTMTQPGSLLLSLAGNDQNGSLMLSGGATGGSFQSLVGGFELDATSDQAPACTQAITSDCAPNASARGADLHYVGVTSNDTRAYFALTSWGRRRTPAGAQRFEVLIDTNGDGQADARLTNTRTPGTDVMVSNLNAIAGGALLDSKPLNDETGTTDTAIFDSDTVVLPVARSVLPAGRFNYGVVGYSGSTRVDRVGVAANGTLTGALSFDPTHPGITVFHAGDPLPWIPDQAGKALTLHRDFAAYKADKALGALLVHLQNQIGNKAQVVTLNDGPPDTSIDGGPAEGSQTTDHGATFTFSASVAGSTFTCSLDGAAPTACSSPTTLAGLADGAHTFQVAATDPVGNSDPTPAQRHFSVVEPPGAPPVTPGTTPTPTPTPATAHRPRSRIVGLPARTKRSKLRKIAGTASDQDGDLARVDVAIMGTGRDRRHRPVCRELDARGKVHTRVRKGRTCAPTTFIKAIGTAKWSLRLPKPLPPGTWTVFSRARDRTGLAEIAFSTAAGNRRSVIVTR